MSTATKLNKLLDTKDAIKTAIINKGVSVSTSDTFATYAAKIGSISSGDPDAALIDFIEEGMPIDAPAPMTIPNGVTKIGPLAFALSAMMESINIPNVTDIGFRAFQSCYSLNFDSLPENLLYIRESAFAECDSLTLNALPSGLLSVESGAFFLCTQLSRMWIPNTVTTIGDYIFFGLNPASFEIYCESASKPAGWSAIWDTYDMTNTLTVHWGTTKAAFDAL